MPHYPQRERERGGGSRGNCAALLFLRLKMVMRDGDALQPDKTTRNGDVSSAKFVLTLRSSKDKPVAQGAKYIPGKHFPRILRARIGRALQI